jgi:hypothetical protein
VTKQIKELFPEYFLNNKTQQYPPEKTLYDIWVGINDLSLILDKKANPSMTTLMEHYEDLIV